MEFIIEYPQLAALILTMLFFVGVGLGFLAGIMEQRQ